MLTAAQCPAPYLKITYPAITLTAFFVGQFYNPAEWLHHYLSCSGEDKLVYRLSKHAELYEDWLNAINDSLVDRIFGRDVHRRVRPDALYITTENGQPTLTKLVKKGKKVKSYRGYIPGEYDLSNIIEIEETNGTFSTEVLLTKAEDLRNKYPGSIVAIIPDSSELVAYLKFRGNEKYMKPVTLVVIGKNNRDLAPDKVYQAEALQLLRDAKTVREKLVPLTEVTDEARAILTEGLFLDTIAYKRLYYVVGYGTVKLHESELEMVDKYDFHESKTVKMPRWVTPFIPLLGRFFSNIQGRSENGEIFSGHIQDSFFRGAGKEFETKIYGDLTDLNDFGWEF